MAECVLGNFKVPVEVPLLLIFYSFMLTDPVKTNLIIYRTCYVSLGYNESECALLGSKHSDNETANLEKLVEPHAAIINMAHSMIDSSFCAIFCLFIGPWSDRFGRKPILIMPVIGFLLTYVAVAVFSALPQISPWYSLLTSIPVMLTGGFSTYITGVLCYITDITSVSNRGVRMAWFEAVVGLGILIGNLTSSYIFYATSYPTVFCIAAVVCSVALVLTFFCIPESVIDRETEGKFSNLFHLSNISDMVKITFKKRQHYERAIVLSCVLILTMYIIVINADSAVIFLYLREKFQWSLEKYTLYSSGHNVAWIFGTLVGVHMLHKVFNFKETVLILVGCFSMGVSTLFQGLATCDWEIYTAGATRCLGGLISPMVRSVVSKIVPSHELGKVFSLIVTSESIFGMIGSPLYTAIYNATITINSGIFNFVSVGIYIFELLITCAIIVMRRVSDVRVASDGQCDRLVNEEQDGRTGELEA